MSLSDADRKQLFADVDAACRKAVWAAVATVAGDEPRVRLVHPTWEGETLWFATSPKSPKAVQIAANPNIDIQYQVSPPEFVHVMVRGRAELISDDTTRRHVWENVMDYDLKDFWQGGPTDPDYVAVKITPTRVEHSKMFGSLEKRIYRP